MQRQKSVKEGMLLLSHKSVKNETAQPNMGVFIQPHPRLHYIYMCVCVYIYITRLYIYKYIPPIKCKQFLRFIVMRIFLTS